MSYARGTRIVLDEEKMQNNPEYTADDVYNIIDEMAKDSGMVKKDKNTYMCRGNKYDLSALGIFIFKKLVLFDWFTKNVKEWVWLDELEGNTDIIAILKNSNKGIWQ